MQNAECRMENEEGRHMLKPAQSTARFPLRSAFCILHSAFILLFTADAFAQTAPPVDQPRQRLLTTQELMQGNGGSLLQAESADQTNADGTPNQKATGYDNLYAVAPAP